MKKALCIGRDSNLWEKCLSSHKFGVTVLTNSEVTKTNVLKELHKMISSTKDGDATVFAFAGIGMTIKDGK